MDVFMPDLSRFWFGSEATAPRAESVRREEPSAEPNSRAQSDYALLCERVSAARFVA
ncbi:MAG: hypothetical protein HYZ17_01100 [Betaproteobacteria bacterium]|jgi:phosphoribosylaminoimidazole-succinocarboxamide synthase|nr:hypothetical protein [Betaproteobacteria bacterium]